MGSCITEQVDGGIGHLRLTRPAKRNAINHQLADEALRAIEGFTSAGVRIVVLSAEGPIFCAGADLDEVRVDPHDPASERLLAGVRRSGLVWVARVAHPVLGAGVSLVSSCHVVIASEDTWFSLPEWQVGLFPAAVIADLEPVVGPRRALAMGLSGERLPAAEARALGLVNDVAHNEQLDDRVHAWTDLLQERSELDSAVTYWRERLRTDHHRQRTATLDRLMQEQYR